MAKDLMNDNKRQRLIPLSEELIQDMLQHEDSEFQTPPGGHINETVGDGKGILSNRQNQTPDSSVNEVRSGPEKASTTSHQFTTIAARENRVKASSPLENSKPKFRRIHKRTSPAISSPLQPPPPMKCERSDKYSLFRDPVTLGHSKILTRGKMCTLIKATKKRLAERNKSLQDFEMTASPGCSSFAKKNNGKMAVLFKAADNLQEEMCKQLRDTEIGLNFCNDMKPCSSHSAATPTPSLQNLVNKVRTNFSLPRHSSSSSSSINIPSGKSVCKMFLDEATFSEHFKRKTPKMLDTFACSLDSFEKCIYDLHGIMSFIQTDRIESEETENQDVSNRSRHYRMEPDRVRGMEHHLTRQMQEINLLATPKSDTTLEMNRHKITSHVLSSSNKYMSVDQLRTGRRASRAVGKKHSVKV